jgi:hypothetical protein
MNHFSLMSALCASSSDGTGVQKSSICSTEDIEDDHPLSKSSVSSADGTENDSISTYPECSVEIDPQFPNHMCPSGMTEA